MRAKLAYLAYQLEVQDTSAKRENVKAAGGVSSMRWRPLSTQAPEAKARSIGFSIPRIASGIMWLWLAKIGSAFEINIQRGRLVLTGGNLPRFHLAIPYVLVKLKCALFHPRNGLDPERDS